MELRLVQHPVVREAQGSILFLDLSQGSLQTFIYTHIRTVALKSDLQKNTNKKMTMKWLASLEDFDF